MNFLKRNLLWTQGLTILLAIGFLTVVSSIFMPILLYPIAAFFIFTLYFFRNPQRSCPQAKNDPAIIISPSDGKIVAIVHDPLGSLEGYHYRISIFLSPIDVHVNWSPLAGTVTGLNYKAGKFIMAFVPKSSELNERNDLILKTQWGSIMVRQIAGTIARRICWWVSVGQSIKAGESFGMIRFGSRIDLFLPESVTLQVNNGERVVGGQTVLGKVTWL